MPSIAGIGIIIGGSDSGDGGAVIASTVGHGLAGGCSPSGKGDGPCSGCDMVDTDKGYVGGMRGGAWSRTTVTHVAGGFKLSKTI